MKKDWKVWEWKTRATPRAPHLRRGQWAEAKALQFLQDHGLRLIDRNYRSRYGEIDLLMLDLRQTLIFVEVRFRASSLFGDGSETIDRNKQQRLKNCAEHFLSSQPAYTDHACRFDVVSIGIGRHNHACVDWIKDAF